MPRPVSKNIPISNHIRMMMENARVDIEDVSKVLGKSVPVLRNKFSNGTFSVEELFAIAEMTGCMMTIKQSGGYEYFFDPKDFCSEETYRRILMYREKLEAEKVKSLEQAFEENDPETVQKMYSRWIKKRKKPDITDDPTD